MLWVFLQFLFVINDNAGENGARFYLQKNLVKRCFKKLNISSRQNRTGRQNQTRALFHSSTQVPRSRSSPQLRAGNLSPHAEWRVRALRKQTMKAGHLHGTCARSR